MDLSSFFLQNFYKYLFSWVAMKRGLFLGFVLIGLVLSLAFIIAENETDVNSTTNEASVGCGNGICEGDEVNVNSSEGCPADCSFDPLENNGIDDSTNETDVNITVECIQNSDCNVNYECEDSYCVLHAEEENETENETHVMHDHHGAMVRMLQLERAIYRMTLQAQAIIDVLRDKGEDVTELEGMLEEMNFLLEESKAVDTTQPNEETVKEFVAIKEDAITLRKDFKDAAKLLLDAEDKQALRLRFATIDREKLKEYHNQIRNGVREYNAERLKTLMEKSGLQADDLGEKVRNGELDAEQALQRLKNAYKGMDGAERERVKNKLREEIQKEDQKEQELLRKAQERLQQEMNARLKERAEKLEARGVVLRSALKDKVNDGRTN